KFYAEKILAADQGRQAEAAASAAAAPAESEDHAWDFLVGLTRSDETAEEPVVAGFQPRRLTATPTDSRHSLGVRFDHLKPGGSYRVTVWFKSAPNGWAMVEGRDSNDPVTGRP